MIIEATQLSHKMILNTLVSFLDPNKELPKPHNAPTKISILEYQVISQAKSGRVFGAEILTTSVMKKKPIVIKNQRNTKQVSNL